MSNNSPGLAQEDTVAQQSFPIGWRESQSLPNLHQVSIPSYFVGTETITLSEYHSLGTKVLAALLALPALTFREVLTSPLRWEERGLIKPGVFLKDWASLRSISPGQQYAGETPSLFLVNIKYRGGRSAQVPPDFYRSRNRVKEVSAAMGQTGNPLRIALVMEARYQPTRGYSEENTRG